MVWHQDLLYFDEAEEGNNHFIWIDGAGNIHDDLLTLPYPNEGMFVVADSEKDYRRPIQQDYIEPTPDYLSDQYRAPVYQPRPYSIGVYIAGSSRSDFERRVGLWDSWHSAELGQGVFKRITARGNTRCLDCVPCPPSEEEPKGFSAKVFRQSYIAANPWWRTETMNEVTGNYDDANVVTLRYTNSGEIPAWPYIVITGVVRNPKVRTATEEVECLYTTTNGDDEIRIDCRPNSLMRRSAFFYEHGGGDPVSVPMSSLSSYISFPRGASDIRLSATSGGAGIVIAAYDYFGSLYTEVAI